MVAGNMVEDGRMEPTGDCFTVGGGPNRGGGRRVGGAEAVTSPARVGCRFFAVAGGDEKFDQGGEGCGAIPIRKFNWRP